MSLGDAFDIAAELATLTIDVLFQIKVVPLQNWFLYTNCFLAQNRNFWSRSGLDNDTLCLKPGGCISS